jgi:flavin reductase (DIM6/NTAB) family NADH-FMN oxidoreductase RutF
MFYSLPGPHGLKHNPFNALIAPRPIGWISTVSGSGVVNLAPFSFFNACASHPPTLMYCCNGAHVDGGEKDSLANVREVPEFVANIVSEDLAQAMNETSAPAPRDVEEFVLAGLEMVASRSVRPPGVAAAMARVECRVVQIVPLPGDPDTRQTNTMVIGLATGIHIDDRVLSDGLVDTKRIRPLARLGYLDYAVIETSFAMKRPRWPKAGS